MEFADEYEQQEERQVEDTLLPSAKGKGKAKADPAPSPREVDNSSRNASVDASRVSPNVFGGDERAFGTLFSCLACADTERRFAEMDEPYWSVGVPYTIADETDRALLQHGLDTIDRRLHAKSLEAKILRDEAELLMTKRQRYADLLRYLPAASDEIPEPAEIVSKAPKRSRDEGHSSDTLPASFSIRRTRSGASTTSSGFNLPPSTTGESSTAGSSSRGMDPSSSQSSSVRATKRSKVDASVDHWAGF